MDEPSQDPHPPAPNQPPRYLPRVAYRPKLAADYPQSSERPPKGKKAPASKARKPGQPDAAAGEKAGVLKEATPELDTYETRRKVRLIVGSVATGVFALSVLLIVHMLTRHDEPVDADAAAASGEPAVPPANANETAARQLLAEAKQYAGKGQDAQAVQRLERLEAAYAATSAAQEAKQALGRHTRGQLLFPPAEVVARRNPPAEQTERPPPPDKVSEADHSEPSHAQALSEAPAIVAVAANPPTGPTEPYRDTGLPRERADVAPRSLPAGFRMRIEAGVHPSGWPNEITCDRDGSPLVLVPAGEFLMGNDRGRPAERPERRLSLPAYYIDQHEVTWRQFDLFAAANGVARPRGHEDVADPELPAVGVTHDEALAFSAWAGKALPSEAQWEKAARATDGRPFPWGSGEPSWDPPRAPRQIDAVCSFPQDLSPYGAFDTAGNAWEWTADLFDVRAYQHQGGATPRTARQKRGSGGPQFTVRGGAAEWDITWRSGMRPDARVPYLGFRCVLMVEDGAPVAAPAGPQSPPATAPDSPPNRRKGSLVPF